jgi:energy-coupling factor transport system permease protein
MNNIVIGQYIPGSSWIYKVDPRIKIGALVLLLVTTFMLSNLFLMSIMFLLIIVMIFTTRVPFIKMIRGMKPLIFLLTFTFFIQMFSITEGKTLLQETMYIGPLSIMAILILLIAYFIVKKYVKFRILLFLLVVFLAFFLQAVLPSSLINFQDFTYEFTIRDKALEYTGFLLLRIMIVVMLSSLLTFTTMPTDITNGLESLLRPLKLIKFPVGELATMLSLTLRFIPTLLEETQKIMKAQASRGVEFSESRFKDKVTQIISLLIPIFVIALKRAEDLANAMEVRGYIIGGKRTKIDTLKFRVSDFVVLFVSLGLLTTAILLKVGVIQIAL